MAWHDIIGIESMLGVECRVRKLYGWNEEVGSNTIEVYVHSLRRKIGAEQIVAVRGVG